MAWNLALRGFLVRIHCLMCLDHERPWDMYISTTEFLEVKMYWTLAIRFKAVIAERPIKFIFKSFTTNTWNLQEVVWYRKYSVNCPIILRGDFVGP